MLKENFERVLAFAKAVAPLGDPTSHEHQRALQALQDATWLSSEGVAHALLHCLETHGSIEDLEGLCASVSPSPAAHIVLSAGVFTGAYRAICMGLAASSHVSVKPSRRDPAFAKLLWELSGGAFTLVDELAVNPSEQVFAYGSDQTLEALKATLPRGVKFWGHGHGVGVAVVGGSSSDDHFDASEALALDSVAFDQRGCLSPRSALVVGDAAAASRFADAAQKALERHLQAIPIGTLSRHEQEDVGLFATSMLYAGPVLGRLGHLVALDKNGERIVVPPVGRVLHVTHTRDAAAVLKSLAPMVAALGTWGVDPAPLRAALPLARHSTVGNMQRPRLDGAVDRRTRPEVIGAG